MNKSKLFSAIACIALVLAFFVVVSLGLEMDNVRQWRMDGEIAKANFLVLSRIVMLLCLLGSAIMACFVSDALTPKTMNSEVYDRTLEI